MSLKEKLKINKLALDKELQEIPADLQEYGELHSQMASKKDKTKLQIETLQARLTNKISKDWKELGFAKSPTVAQIDAFIKTDKEYQELSEKLLDIQEELSYYNATLNSLQAKRSALGNLVSLFMTQYWSDVPLETQQNKLGDTMRRRKRKD